MNWSRRVAPFSGIPFGSGSDAPYSLMYGWPDPALFPAKELAAATLRALQSDPAAAMQYGSIRGQKPLLQLILGRLAEEGIESTPDNLLITTGSASAIGLAARALLDEGDVALVEAPTFPGAVTIFRSTGATMRCVPMDAGGIDVAGAEAVIVEIEKQGLQPKLLYTMPTFHNPTGLTTSEGTRRDLLDLARRHDLFVIEDDAYHDLYYDEKRGPLPPTLYALDGGEGRVMLTGSFSKILAPGVRLGWALAHPDLIHKMMHLKDESGTSPFAQMAAAEFARDGNMEHYIASLRAAYRARRDAMLGALEKYMPADARWTRPMGGFFVWLTLRPTIEPAVMRERAMGLGVDYMPGEACFPNPQDVTPGTHLRLAFSQRSPNDIETAIIRLAQAIRG